MKNPSANTPEPRRGLGSHVSTEVRRTFLNTACTMTVGTFAAYRFGLQQAFWPTGAAVSAWAAMGVLNPPTYARAPLVQGDGAAARTADFFARSLGFIATVAYLRHRLGPSVAGRKWARVALPLAGAVASGVVNPLIDAMRSEPSQACPAAAAPAASAHQCRPWRRAALTAGITGAAATVIPKVLSGLPPGTPSWAVAAPKSLIAAATVATGGAVLAEDALEQRMGLRGTRAVPPKDAAPLAGAAAATRVPTSPATSAATRGSSSAGSATQPLPIKVSHRRRAAMLMTPL